MTIGTGGTATSGTRRLSPRHIPRRPEGSAGTLLGERGTYVDRAEGGLGARLHSEHPTARCRLLSPAISPCPAAWPRKSKRKASLRQAQPSALAASICAFHSCSLAATSASAKHAETVTELVPAEPGTVYAITDGLGPSTPDALWAGAGAAVASVSGVKAKLWTLVKDGQQATATVRTVDDMGLELRYEWNGELRQSQVYRDKDALHADAIKKREDLIARAGWTCRRV